MSASIVKLFSLVTLCCNVCNAYKLLVVFPFPGKSHGILGEGYVRRLLDAGHEVTYIAAVPLKDAHSRLRQIDLSSNFEDLPTEKYLDTQKIMNNEVDLNIKNVLDLTFMVTQPTLNKPAVQSLMMDPEERFDAVIAEWMYSELYSGLSFIFGCPLIWSSSMEPHAMVLSLIDEDPNPSYVPDHLSSRVPPLGFLDRVAELYALLHLKYLKWAISGEEEKAFARLYGEAASKRGLTLPPYEEVKYNGSLMLGNSHVSSGYALRLPQNYKAIGGYHISDEIKPLPTDTQKIMDEAKNGVIFFSLGSMLKSKQLPEEIKTGLLKVFAGLKQTVIWKFEEPLKNKPNNVHIVDWAPQQGILAHPNCVLFISHGGLLSTTEALHFGVPIIGVPMFADQFTNVNKAVNKGFAKRVNLNYDFPANLKEAIEDILVNPKYRQRAHELSLVYHDRPVPPGAELVHWVEHVARTRGAPHLRSPALHVPIYQKMYLDLLALVLGALVALTALIQALICRQNVQTKQKKQ